MQLRMIYHTTQQAIKLLEQIQEVQVKERR